MKYLSAAAMLLLSLTLALAGGTVRSEDIPKYIKMLKTSVSSADRTKAAEMIGKRGLVNAKDVKDAVDPLKNALTNDKDAAVRRAAAQALGNIHPNAEETVPFFIDTLKAEKVMDVKLGLALALGAYGSEAKPALPTLRELAGSINNKKSAEAQTVQAAIKSI